MKERVRIFEGNRLLYEYYVKYSADDKYWQLLYKWENDNKSKLKGKKLRMECQRLKGKAWKCYQTWDGDFTK